jgi:hypothetical protein
MGSMVHGFEAAGAGNGEELRLMSRARKRRLQAVHHLAMPRWCRSVGASSSWTVRRRQTSRQGFGGVADGGRRKLRVDGGR